MKEEARHLALVRTALLAPMFILVSLCGHATVLPTATPTSQPLITLAPPSPTPTPMPRPALDSVFFIDDQVGWASGYIGGDIGGVILSTTDGGHTWRQQYSSELTISDLEFVSAQVGWALASSQSGSQNDTVLLLGTKNGGQSWQIRQSSHSLTKIDFISPTTGWALRGKKLQKTLDGGSTWGDIATPGSIDAMCIVDAEHGWAAGNHQVFRTTDGGQRWTGTSLLADVVLDDLKCIGPDVVWALGFGGAAVMNIDYELYCTADAGAHWAPLLSHTVVEHPALHGPPGPGSEPGPLAVADGTTAWFIGTCPACQETGTADVVSTSDGGASWRPAVTVPGVPEASDMSCPDQKHCWVVGSQAVSIGSNTFSAQAVIAETSDAGANWTNQYPTPSPN